jgi:hypothetical protein
MVIFHSYVSLPEGPYHPLLRFFGENELPRFFLGFAAILTATCGPSAHDPIGYMVNSLCFGHEWLVSFQVKSKCISTQHFGVEQSEHSRQIDFWNID